jgi:predicted PurR-regulated permease PerM
MVLLLLIGFLTLFGVYIVTEIHQFVAHLGGFKEQIQKLVSQVSTWLHRLGIPYQQGELEHFLRPDRILAFFKSSLLQLGNQFSNTLLILFTTSFLIMDSHNFQTRLHYILRERPKQRQAIEEVFGKIHTYFKIMARVSLITGLSAFALLWFFGVDYALLWASLTFLLNFVPVIGSIIAALPPVVVALVEQGWSTALWVAAGYIVINSVVGNILQPAMMGKGLGLNTFTVFWSMVFWGWFFGPTGMILSVPLTMVVQFMLMQYEETRWLGFLLSDYREKSTGR